MIFEFARIACRTCRWLRVLRVICGAGALIVAGVAGVAGQDRPDPVKAVAPVPMEVALRAASGPDDDGARWKVQLAEPERWASYQGRESRFWLHGLHLFTPCGEWLLDRRLSDGHFAPEGIRCPEPIQQVVVSRDGGTFAFTCAPREDKAEITDIMLSTRQRPSVRLLSGHKSPPWRLVLSPDGSRMVSCAGDGTLRLWDTNSGAEIRQFDGNGYRNARGE